MKKSKCPICKNKFEWEKSEFRPFCSERCKLIDLGHWAGEKYFVPGEKVTLPSLSANENEPKKFIAVKKLSFHFN